MQNLISNSWGRGILFLALLVFFAPVMRAQSDAEKNYKAKCAGCHGPDGSGNTPPGKALKVRDFHDAEVQKETDQELAEIISKGKNKMPKFADKLKEAEIKDLAAYVLELGKKK